MTDYPSALPCLLSHDLTISRQFDTAPTQMESGWIKQRRMSEFNIESVTLNWNMTVAEFKSWFEWMDVNGFDWFKILIQNADNPTPGKATLRLAGPINYSIMKWDRVVVSVPADFLVNGPTTTTVVTTGDNPWT